MTKIEYTVEMYKDGLSMTIKNLPVRIFELIKDAIYDIEQQEDIHICYICKEQCSENSQICGKCARK